MGPAEEALTKEHRMTRLPKNALRHLRQSQSAAQAKEEEGWGSPTRRSSENGLSQDGGEGDENFPTDTVSVALLDGARDG